MMVEMSGIEPESERFVPRISTSIASLQVSPDGPLTGEGGPLASRWNPKAPLLHS